MFWKRRKVESLEELVRRKEASYREWEETVRRFNEQQAHLSRKVEKQLEGIEAAAEKLGITL